MCWRTNEDVIPNVEIFVSTLACLQRILFLKIQLYRTMLTFMMCEVKREKTNATYSNNLMQIFVHNVLPKEIPNSKRTDEASVSVIGPKSSSLLLQPIPVRMR